MRAVYGLLATWVVCAGGVWMSNTPAGAVGWLGTFVIVSSVMVVRDSWAR